MQATEPLARFLVTAKTAGYAADDGKRLRALDDGGSEVRFEQGEFVYRDRWYCGARFSGQELVWRSGRLLWSLSFYGVTSPLASEEFFHFHKRALGRPPPDAPFRGPALHREGHFVYVHDWSGTLAVFHGNERAFRAEQEIFRLDYRGGLLE